MSTSVSSEVSAESRRDLRKFLRKGGPVTRYGHLRQRVESQSRRHLIARGYINRYLKGIHLNEHRDID